MYFDLIEAISLVDIFSETMIFGLEKFISVLDLPNKISISSFEISFISFARALKYSSSISLITFAYSSEQYL